MLHTKLLAGALVGMLGLAATGGSLSAGGWTPGSWAGTPFGKMLSGNLGRLLVLRSDLNLTDQQREKVKAVVAGHKSEIVAEAKAVAERRRALRHAVLTEKLDEAAIRKAAEELGREVGSAAVLAAKIKGEVVPVLTDPQKELIKKCIADCEASADRFFDEATKAK